MSILSDITGIDIHGPVITIPPIIIPPIDIPPLNDILNNIEIAGQQSLNALNVATETAIHDIFGTIKDARGNIIKSLTGNACTMIGSAGVESLICAFRG